MIEVDARKIVEGAAAFNAGLAVDTCPYDVFIGWEGHSWLHGWWKVFYWRKDAVQLAAINCAPARVVALVNFWLSTFAGIDTVESLIGDLVEACRKALKLRTLEWQRVTLIPNCQAEVAQRREWLREAWEIEDELRDAVTRACLLGYGSDRAGGEPPPA